VEIEKDLSGRKGEKKYNGTDNQKKFMQKGIPTTSSLPKCRLP
jgi:hypothetical protein